VAILSSAFCFAVNAVLIKRVPPIPPLAAGVGIFLCAALIRVLRKIRTGAGEIRYPE
jgi:drug/metabolite transporter (DMT)-like permease